MKTTVYIPDNEAELYERAKAQLGDSISATFVRCLKRELENLEVPAERIVIDIEDSETGRIRKKAFQGRWIVGSLSKPMQYTWDESSSVYGCSYLAAAFTKKGNIAVVEFNNEEAAEEGVARSIDVYSTFDELDEANKKNVYPRYPLAFIQDVGDEIGEAAPPEELDI